MPKDFDFEEQAHRIESDEMLNDFYGAETIRKSPQQFVLDQVEKLNKDQRAAFDRISSAILDGDNRRLFFVEGAGGCGKFYCSLICYISVNKTCFRQNLSIQHAYSMDSCRKTMYYCPKTA